MPVVINITKREREFINEQGQVVGDPRIHKAEKKIDLASGGGTVESPKENREPSSTQESK